MGTVNSVAPIPSGEEGGGAVREPYFDPDDPYPVTLLKIRETTLIAARNFMRELEGGRIANDERNYRFGEEILHATDCSGLVYRVLFANLGGDRLQARGYFAEAMKQGHLLDDPRQPGDDLLHHPPQPGDVFFYSDNHSATSPSVNHTGFVEGCQENDGELTCTIISAVGDVVKDDEGHVIRDASGYAACPDKKRCHVVRDEIKRDPTGNWSIDYNADGKGSTPRGSNAYFFADSLKMRGIPSAEEVEPLGGVDLDVPFPLDGNMLGMGDLKGFRISADGTTITLYASKSDGASPPEGAFQTRGVNLVDVQEILNSLSRTGGTAPTFTLLPDAASAAAINGALTVAWEALEARPEFYPEELGRLLYGESVWRFLGVQNPASFTMQAIFSDPALRNTHVGDVLMSSDILLKTLALGDQGDQTPTSFIKKAEALVRGGENVGLLETSRFWFEVDPASFVIRKMTEPDGSVVYDFADVQLHVSCRPIRFDEQKGGAQDTAQGCESGSVSSWYADSLNTHTTMAKIMNRHPVLAELKELYKAVAVAKILYQNGITLPGSSSDSSEGSLAWETPESAQFLPLIYVGQPGGPEGKAPYLLAAGGGGVELNVPLPTVVSPGVFTGDSFYLREIPTPISDVAPDVRALRIKVKSRPSGSIPSGVFSVPPEMLKPPTSYWVTMPPLKLKPITPLKPVVPKSIDMPGLMKFLAVDLINKALYDPDPAVRELSANRLIDVVYVPTLIEKLQSGTPTERAFAAGTLGNIGPTAAEAVPALKQALDDSDPHVRNAVAQALEQIGPINPFKELGELIRIIHTHEDPDVRASAYRNLANLAPVVVPVLIEQLSDEDYHERLLAAGILGAMGPAAVEAVPALEQALNDSDPGVRETAAWALKQIDPANSTTP